MPIPPTNLREGPFLRTAEGGAEVVARIIRFGVIGSHMPGHETLGDGETMALAGHVLGLRK